MQELVDKVWGNTKFHTAFRNIELAWLRREIVAPSDDLRIDDANRMMRAAAILACSVKHEHRRAAFRAATCTYELFGANELPLDQALRVVLSRLGNFPSFGTREDVDSAGSLLPAALSAEEIAVAERQRVVVDDQDIYLTDFQHRLWSGLTARKRIALAAPTSAGKSFVLQNYLATALGSATATSIVYIVPTRALIAQVAEDLMAHFAKLSGSRPEIITVPLDADEDLPKRAVFVMTQERVQLSLSAQPKFRPDLVIVDEAHSITEGSRGVVLQWVIDDLLRRNPYSQILFASPMIRNLSVFGRLFGLTDVVEFPSVEPTVSQNFLLVDIASATKGRVNIRSAGEGNGDVFDVAVLDVGQTLASRLDKLVHIPARLGGTQSSIIYANGAAEAEKIAMQLLDLRLDEEASTEQRDALAALAREAVHPNYALVECVKRGIAFHYSNMPAQLRRAVEQSVSDGDIDFLACTSTLLQGVNLPAKNLFMCAPEKGKGKPLESTDFWNLSGRAGRLRKEFQGNIFLIDYGKWKKKPLDGPKDTDVVPAIETSVLQNSAELLNVIADEAVTGDADISALETSFVRLFSDHKKGELAVTLDKLGVFRGSDQFLTISSALTAAAASVTLPADVIKRTPNVSAHRQQRLYSRLQAVIDQGREHARLLIPAHPRESEAFQSYADILELCHEVILGYDTTKGLHRFHALMALKWMRGMPLPQIIDEQINRKTDGNQQKIIRDTLDIIEKEIRFQAVRLIGCYNSLLVFGLDVAGMVDMASSIPSIPLYLEIGASDRTMISFISLGLSRVTAMKLNDLSARKDLDVTQALRWLSSRPMDALGLSPLLRKEVETVVAANVQFSA
ncbi:DEAD/DEAH box type DNA/RNA helicase protein (plasmid) [Rhizobium sp. CIAT894]|nr:DEAD/DEAH box type DNA/RNA helicase protein [Rhizobium sp. CIAT894]